MDEKEIRKRLAGRAAEYMMFDMSTLFWTLFYRTTYLNFLEFICKSKIIYLIPSRVNKLAIARP